MKTQKTYCGLIRICGGSSWAQADTPEDAAKQAVQVCRNDWGKLLKLEKDRKFKIAVYDISDFETWFAEDCGFVAYKSNGTEEEYENGTVLKPVKVVEMA